MVKIFIFILSLMMQTVTAAAQDFNASFNQGLLQAKENRQQAITQLKNFQPQTFIHNYTDKPKEIIYQSQPNKLQEDGQQALQRQGYAKDIKESIKNRPQIMLSETQSKAIMARADAYTEQLFNPYKDCTQQKLCTTQYTEKTCEEPPQSFYMYCQKILQVEPETTVVKKPYRLALTLRSERTYGSAIVDLMTGEALQSGPRRITVSLTGRLPSDLDHFLVEGKVIVTPPSKAEMERDYPRFSIAGNHVLLDVRLNERPLVNTTLQIEIDIVQPQITLKDHWTDNCVGIAQSCHLQAENCILGQSTRTIAELPATRECWEKELTYRCNPNTEQSLCRPLREQGCEQIHSVCKTQEHGQCRLYVQTFQCPSKQCNETQMICNGQTFCLTGDCANSEKTVDPDFDHAVSALSAAKEAASQYHGATLFSGEKKTCHNKLLGAADCCRDEGWLLKDIHLLNCTPEEKELGTAKERKQVHYVGQYCDTDALGQCVTRLKVYCAFPSLLSRIIQEQGREGQLGVSFGDAKHPNCSGITPQELSQLDLSKIDFSEYYAELNKEIKLKDPAEVTQKMTDQIQQRIKDYLPHES